MTPPPGPRTRGHAVVIGGSMAGLIAARVASDHFAKVTILDRDRLSSAPGYRKGTPQARHLHALLRRGEDILTGLFPGLADGLVAEGAERLNLANDVAWYHFGGWKVRSADGGRVDTLFLSRPFLEEHVRQRVLALPNVQLLETMDVVGLDTASGRNAVQGVLHRPVGATAAQTLAADLVVDASGRGTRTPAWLEAIGRSRVKESTLHVDVAYSTRIYKAPPPGTFPWKVLFIIGTSPQSKRMAGIAPIEGGRWICQLIGTLGEHPPTDLDGWLEFSRGLPVPDFTSTVAKLEPLGDITGYKFPAHLRRHYDAMADFPDGLVVLGDAHCSFNPVFGQGMTVSALGGQLFQQHLAAASGGAALPPGFSRRFQQALARLSDQPWQVSTSEDMRYPEVQGTRTLGTRFSLWYGKRLNELAHSDPESAMLFYRTINMMATPAELLGPAALFKVLRGPRNSPAARAPR